jgi:hypothetical protein
MKFTGFLGFALLFASSTLAQSSATLPSYFPPGITKTTDSFGQRQEIVRALMATRLCNQGYGAGPINTYVEPNSHSFTTNIVSTSSITEPNAKMRVVLDHYVDQADGSVRVTTLCEQKIITAAQEAIDQADLIAVALAGAHADFVFYEMVVNWAIEARAEKLGISKADLIAQLDEKVPGYDITFRELHRLPKPMRESDFIPRELHLGYNTSLHGILGVTWLNTGIIYYNPEARMIDYISETPAVMGHEMVHVNVNLEKFPMSQIFDAEFMACLPEMIVWENQTDLPDHGYLEELRELDEIYYSFDFKQMEKDIFKYDLEGNTVYDIPKYKYYYDQLQVIKKENLNFFQHVAIPEFYSDPIWWGAVNKIRGDDNSVFRITMALHYNPTLLGGSQKTMEWLETHKEEILDIAKDAFKAGVGEKGKAMGEMSDVSPRMVEQYHQMFTATERAQLEAFFTQHPEKLAELRKLPPSEALAFLSKFKTNSGVAVQ